MSFVISSRYFRRKCDSGTGIQMSRPNLKEVSRKQAAASYRVQNPSRTENRDHLQYTAITRPTATVPPNTLLSTGTLAISNNEATTVSVTTPLRLPRNASYTITVDRFPHLNPEVSIIRLPINTSERTEGHPGNQGNDDVVYLYTVDSRPTQSLAEEVDLTQESQDNNSSGNVQVIELENLSVTTAKAENTEPGKTTVTKNRKRKLKGGGATKKRKTIDDAQLVCCSLCNIDNESLAEMAEKMFLGSCGHLFCSPCTRRNKLNDCETCGKKINALRKVFF